MNKIFKAFQIVGLCRHLIKKSKDAKEALSYYRHVEEEHHSGELGITEESLYGQREESDRKAFELYEIINHIQSLLT